MLAVACPCSSGFDTFQHPNDTVRQRVATETSETDTDEDDWEGEGNSENPKRECERGEDKDTEDAVQRILRDE